MGPVSCGFRSNSSGRCSPRTREISMQYVCPPTPQRIIATRPADLPGTVIMDPGTPRSMRRRQQPGDLRGRSDVLGRAQLDGSLRHAVDDTARRVLREGPAPLVADAQEAASPVV